MRSQMYELTQIVTYPILGTLSAYALNICDPKEALAYLSTATIISFIACKILPNNDSGVIQGNSIGAFTAKLLLNSLGYNITLAKVIELQFCIVLVGVNELIASRYLKNDRIKPMILPKPEQK